MIDWAFFAALLATGGTIWQAYLSISAAIHGAGYLVALNSLTQEQVAKTKSDFPHWWEFRQRRIAVKMKVAEVHETVLSEEELQYDRHLDYAAYSWFMMVFAAGFSLVATWPF